MSVSVSLSFRSLCHSNSILCWVSRTLLHLCRQRDSLITFISTRETVNMSKEVTLGGTDEDKQLLRRTWSTSPVLPVLLLFYLSVLSYGMLCVCVCGQKRYKSRAKDLLKSGCNELQRPDILTALYSSTMSSKVNSHRSDRLKIGPVSFVPSCCFWTHFNSWRVIPPFSVIAFHVSCHVSLIREPLTHLKMHCSWQMYSESEMQQIAAYET